MCVSMRFPGIGSLAITAVAFPPPHNHTLDNDMEIVKCATTPLVTFTHKSLFSLLFVKKTGNIFQDSVHPPR